MHYLKKYVMVMQNMPLVKQNVMKLEVFILGRQRIDQKRGMGEREKRED